LAEKKVQVLLRSGTMHLTTWLDDEVKVGDLITLKKYPNPEPVEVWWQVVEVYAAEDQAIGRGWNNNI
jgi:hypothetical protein